MMSALPRLTPARLLFVALALPPAVLICIVAGWALLEARLADTLRAEAADQGFELRWSDFDAWPWGSAVARDLTVLRDGVELASFEHLEVDVRWLHSQTLSLAPPLERIEVRGGRAVPPNTYSSARTVVDAPHDLQWADTLARVFGGEPPSIRLRDVSVSVDHFGSPVSTVHIDDLTTSRRASAWRAEGRVRLEARDDATFDIPLYASLRATMSLDPDTERWTAQPLRLRFDREASAVLKGEHRVFFRSVGFDPQHGIAVGDLRLPGVGDVDEVLLGPLRAVASGDFEAVELVRIRGAHLQIPAAFLEHHWSTRRPTEPRPTPRTVDEALAAAWDAAFAATDELAVQLGDRLPPHVVVEGSMIDFGTRRLRSLAAIWVGGHSPSWSVEAELVEQRRPIGRFLVAAESGDVPHIEVRGRHVALDWLQGLAQPLLPLEVDVRGSAQFELELTFDPSGSRPFSGSVKVANLVVDDRRLAEVPVTFRHPIEYAFEGRHRPGAPPTKPRLLSHAVGRGSPSANDRTGALEIERGILSVGDVSAELTAQLYGLAALPDDLPGRFDVRFDLPPTDVREIWDTIPSEVLGPLRGARLVGELRTTLEFEAPLRDLSDTRWTSDTELLDFRVVDLPHEVDVRRLLRGDTFILSDREVDFERTITIPPMRSDRDARGATPRPPWKDHSFDGDGACGTWVYVPLDWISPHMPDGVLTTEDRRFFRHDGFSPLALRDAMEKNVEAGEFVRGGSTISMQLVKNLFLNGEKTLSRKVREAFLVWVMESVLHVPKTRILEVYLNVIEYGPGIYGIHDAATYYFGKRPSELSVSEVAWFVSILPNPKHYHRAFERGHIGPKWWEKMQVYIDRMYRNGFIDEYELLTAKAARPRFRPNDEACSARHRLNDPTRFANHIEPQRAWMKQMRVRQGMSRSEVLRWAESSFVGPMPAP